MRVTAGLGPAEVLAGEVEVWTEEETADLGAAVTDKGKPD